MPVFVGENYQIPHVNVGADSLQLDPCGLALYKKNDKGGLQLYLPRSLDPEKALELHEEMFRIDRTAREKLFEHPPDDARLMKRFAPLGIAQRAQNHTLKALKAACALRTLPFSNLIDLAKAFFSYWGNIFRAYMLVNRYR